MLTDFQNSVTDRLTGKYGGIFNSAFIAHLLVSLLMKEFWK